MLHHREKLDVGEPHVEHVLGELGGRVPGR